MMSPAPFDVVAEVLRHSTPSIVRRPVLTLGCETGYTIPLDVERWMATPGPDEAGVLAHVAPPVLDVGCGPGRHTIALVERGVGAIGLDSAPAIVRLASERGAPVVFGSVFGRVPGVGRWGTVLLLDGNLGIGGDPHRLLRRVRSLLRPRGRVLVELDPTEPAVRSMVVEILSDGLARTGERFGWAVVGPGALAGLAGESGFAVREFWEANGRWFAGLQSV
jgi:SAM-dependent methyltransferase